MTRDELNARIIQLRQAAQQLEEPEKTFKLDDIAKLEMLINSMALAALNEKLSQITLPDLDEIDAKISAANDATEAYEKRVNFFNNAIDFVIGKIAPVI